jgi:CHAD domain-containing protein
MKLAPISIYAVAETKLRLNRFSQNLRHAAEHPGDPKAIHDLRVAIRRAVQACKTFRDLLEPVPVKKLRRRLRALMELCAAVRNCDVALLLLEQVGITTGAAVSRLQKTRGDAAKQLLRRLEKERLKRYPAPVARSHPKDRDWKLDQSLDANLSRLLPALAEIFFAAGKAAVSPRASYRELHRFRLRTKRFRYTLELFARFHGTEMAHGVAILKGLQDRLGAINDCVTTIAILGRDRRAAAAVGKLLRQRKARLQTFARSQFVPKKENWWKRWLAQTARSAA